MARKPEDIFIIGSESPGPEAAEHEASVPQDGEPRNPFAVAPEEAHAEPVRRLPRRIGRRLALLAAAAAIGVLAVASLLTRSGDGSAETPTGSRVAPPRPPVMVGRSQPLHRAAAPRSRRGARRSRPRGASAPQSPTRARRHAAESQPGVAEAPEPSPVPVLAPEPESQPTPEPAAPPSPPTAASPTRAPRPEFSFER